jgi:two-component system chemotaxis response regulator CheB
MIRDLNPDVITLDVEMPRMDGLDFLRTADAPAPHAGGDGQSTLTERGAEVTLQVPWSSAPSISSPSPRSVWPTGSSHAGLPTSRTRSVWPPRRVCTGLRPPATPRPGEGAAPGGAHKAAAPVASLGRLSTEKIVFIGASTGGTEATREVLMALPADCACRDDHAAHAARLHAQTTRRG